MFPFSTSQLIGRKTGRFPTKQLALASCGHDRLSLDHGLLATRAPRETSAVKAHYY
jgi:hypothetical protein